MGLSKLLILLFLAVFGMASPALAVSKDSAIQTVSQWQTLNQTQLKDVDSRLESGFQKNAASAADLKTLVDLRQELLLRQNFYDRLKFQIDTHYSGQNLKSFLPVVLKDMALRDAKSADEPVLWPFMNQLAQTITDTVTDDENAMATIEGVIGKSSIRKPKAILPEALSRDYDNGRDHARADSISRENIGEAVEKQIQKTN